MTISLSDNSPRVNYTVNQGVTQATFTVPFEFFEDADLNVFVDGTKKTLTTHYTTSDDSGDSQAHTSGTTGFVQMTTGNAVTGASGGSSVVITRDIDIDRTTDFPTSGPFDVATLNTELDRMIAIAADIDDSANRALILADSDTTASLILPDVSTRANKQLGFDGSGDLVAEEGKVSSVTISASGLSAGATPTASATFTASSGALALALGIPAGATGATGATGGGGSLDNIVEDTSPELGGDLDVLARDIVSSSNRNIDLLPNGSGKVNLDGDGSTGGVTISDGLVDIRTGTGSRSQIKLYCESSNQHAQTIQPQPHSASVTNTLTLPAGGDGTLVSTNAQSTFLKAQVPSTYTDALSATSGVLDFDTYQNFIITLASGSNTLAAPTTEASQIGQTGVIILIQPSSGSAATLSLHGDYESPAAGGITLSSANNAYDVLPYVVKADNSILLGAAQLAFA